MSPENVTLIHGTDGGSIEMLSHVIVGAPGGGPQSVADAELANPMTSMAVIPVTIRNPLMTLLITLLILAPSQIIEVRPT
jgi:hypothetical protein